MSSIFENELVGLPYVEDRSRVIFRDLDGIATLNQFIESFSQREGYHYYDFRIFEVNDQELGFH